MKSALCSLPSALSLSLLLAGCHSKAAVERSGTATDVWTRSYALEKTDELSIGNRNGPIDIETFDGASAEVSAERIIHAGSQKTADDLLPKIEIEEDRSRPGVIAVRTKGIEGILVGVSFEVKYHVRVPTWANVRVQGANANVTVHDVGGRLIAGATNGNLKVTGARGGVETRVLNGASTVDIAELDEQPVSVRGTNGPVSVSIPGKARAEVSLSANNGKIAVNGLDIQASDPNAPERGRSPRLSGRLNGGGSLLEVQTLNGSLTLSARESLPADAAPPDGAVGAEGVVRRGATIKP